jgi:hypothetical protein
MLQASLVYSTELEEGKTEAFFVVLINLPIEEIEFGFFEHFKTSRRFPTPAEIISKVKRRWFDLNSFSDEEFPWQ